MPEPDESTDLSPTEPSQQIKSEAEPTPKHGLSRAWAWVRASRRRTIAAIAVAVLLLGGVAVGATDLRYPVLGVFLTGSVQVKVTDTTTKQPVPKATVAFKGASGLTNNDGLVTLTKVTLGRGQLTVRKTGYTAGSVAAVSPVHRGASVAVALKPNGIKVVAQITNGITGGALEGVEVKSGDASALTDPTGRAELSLPLSSANTQQILSLQLDGYNELDAPVAVKNGGSILAAKLIPAGKVYFQSNRSGRIDIYGSNLDGSQSEVVLAGTGSEDAATGILTSVTDPHVLAIVSSRDGRRNGSLFHDLFILNTESRKLTKIDEDIDFNNYRAFIGNTVVYQKNKPGNSYGYGYCSDIKTYDVTTGKTATFYQGDNTTAGCPTIKLGLKDSFIYSVRDSSDANRIGLYEAKINNSGKRISSTYSDTTVRRAKQTLLSEYYSATGAVWDSIDLGGFAVTRLPSGPSIETSRYYNDSPDGTYSAFIEERDGKSELYLADGNGGNEKKLTSIGSANQFVQWYGDDYMVFSSTKTDENALYVIGTGGGTPLKISDFYRGNERTYGGGGNPYN